MFHIKSFVFSPIQENTYLVYNENNNCLIIDPGCYFPEEKDQLSSYLASQNLNPVKLLNTHCHLDHIFGNKFIAETYGLTLHLHEKEQIPLQMAPASGLLFNLPFDNYNGNFQFLKEGDKITLDEDELEVILAPGHSPGSICFYCAKQHFIIAGDVLFYRSIGRTDLPGGDHPTLIRSIREKLFVLPGETIVYNGHGPKTTIGEEMKFNPFLQ